MKSIFIAHFISYLSEQHHCWLIISYSAAIMASSIRLFQFNQKFHRFIGIYSSHPNQEQYSLNLKNFICFIVLTQYGLTVGAYLVLEANSIVDYAFAFIGLISIAYCMLIYVLFIWQLENTLKFIENCERFIAKSKYQTESQSLV